MKCVEKGSHRVAEWGEVGENPKAQVGANGGKDALGDGRKDRVQSFRSGDDGVGPHPAATGGVPGRHRPIAAG